MTRLERGPEPGQSVFVGIDLARSTWTFSARWGNREQRRWSTPSDLRHVEALPSAFGGCALHVAYEACGFGYEIAWALQGRGAAITVVAPSTIARAPGLRVKTDRLDARALAEHLEQGRLKGIAIPTRRDHEHRQLSRLYAQVTQDRKRAQARLRAMLQEHGRLGPGPRQGWRAYGTWLATQELPSSVRRCVDELLAARAEAAQRAAGLRAALLRIARDAAYAPLVTRLEAQPGIGRFTAIRLRLELGDLRRFRRAAAFPHYLGLTPSEYSSGPHVQRGHLTKYGPGAVRSWLVQCAWVSIRPDRGDAALRATFERLCPRVGKKRAIIAVTRRLALRVRARWLADDPAPAVA